MSASSQEQLGPEPFTGRPLETAVQLIHGIADNYHGLVEGLKGPDPDISEPIKEYGYTLGADLLTGFRALAVPYIAHIFNKPLEERARTDAVVVAIAWLTDKVDGILSEKANKKTLYGPPADKGVDKAIWHLPAIVQVAHRELPVTVAAGIAARDFVVEEVRDEATDAGDKSAHTARRAGQLKTTFMAFDQVFSASPAGARHPRIKRGIHWVSLAASFSSGLLTVAEIECGRQDLDYAEQNPIARARLGVTAVARQFQR